MAKNDNQKPYCNIEVIYCDLVGFFVLVLTLECPR